MEEIEEYLGVFRKAIGNELLTMKVFKKTKEPIKGKNMIFLPIEIVGTVEISDGRQFSVIEFYTIYEYYSDSKVQELERAMIKKVTDRAVGRAFIESTGPVTDAYIDPYALEIE